MHTCFSSLLADNGFMLCRMRHVFQEMTEATDLSVINVSVRDNRTHQSKKNLLFPPEMLCLRHVLMITNMLYTLDIKL